MAELFTYPDAVQNLRNWLAALSAASSGASYSIGGRTLNRQDITEIRAEIQRWHNTVVSMESRAAGKTRPLGATASFPRPGAGSPAGDVLYPGELWRSGLT